jgi:hypothetical protein
LWNPRCGQPAVQDQIHQSGRCREAIFSLVYKLNENKNFVQYWDSGIFHSVIFTMVYPPILLYTESGIFQQSADLFCKFGIYIYIYIYIYIEGSVNYSGPN